MRLTEAVLVIADISGYTDFIRKREIALIHAEQVIADCSPPWSRARPIR